MRTIAGTGCCQYPLSCSAWLPTQGRKAAHNIYQASKQEETFFLPSLTHTSQEGVWLVLCPHLGPITVAGGWGSMAGAS